ncbi:MAG: stage III sporulation protein AA [Limnochordia bacterium]|jgi:stage III sporulation protein AA|nr:stage III sporulation protein AA [Limnochordia bacterium]
MQKYLAPSLRGILEQATLSRLEEVRIRLNRPLMVKDARGFSFLSHNGQLSVPLQAYIVTRDDLERTVQLVTESSWYAWEQEIQGGYLTLPGGHRVGIGGQAVYSHGVLKTIKNISSLNFRQGRAVLGAADPIIGQVASKGGSQVLSTLIVSPPGCGKTTLLRDLARQVANCGLQVVIIDERSEIASCYLGVPQLDVGVQTDVLDGYGKEIGVHHALRGLGPQVVVTDEIGHGADAQVLSELARSGVKVIATCHGDSWENLRGRSWAKESLGIFELVVILSRRMGPGTIESVLRVRGGT